MIRPYDLGSSKEGISISSDRQRDVYACAGVISGVDERVIQSTFSKVEVVIEVAPECIPFFADAASILINPEIDHPGDDQLRLARLSGG